MKSRGGILRSRNGTQGEEIEDGDEQRKWVFDVESRPKWNKGLLIVRLRW